MKGILPMKIKNIYLLATASLGLASCNNAITSSSSAATGYVQVERLARPAINEGLVLSNTNLNKWNEIAPSADGTSAPVTEAATVLGVIYNYADALSLNPPTVAQVAGGFLPDVMRIDTTQAFAGDPGTALTNVTDGKMAYAGCVSAGAKLCGGRKLKDNVMQITLNYLAHGTADNLAAVPYDPDTQRPEDVLTTFPYVAAPYIGL
jgi:hypothetical protein